MAEKAKKIIACLFLPGSFIAYSLSVHLGRQGEFKCKAAEKSTEGKIKESEAITDKWNN